MWIQTASGKAIDLPNPRYQDLSIEDIGHGLAQTARYAGQAHAFYSVAEHSVNVWRYAREWAKREKLSPEQSKALQRAALMHDAQEAYLGDVPKPLKMLLPDYRLIENRFEAAIAARFGIQVHRWRAVVKEGDVAVLLAERRELLDPSPRPDWSHGIVGEPWRDCEVLGWSWQLAKQNFLRIAGDLNIAD